MNERGAMTISLKEHILEPDVFPGEADGGDRDTACEELLKVLQLSIPFQVDNQSLLLRCISQLFLHLTALLL